MCPGSVRFEHLYNLFWPILWLGLLADVSSERGYRPLGVPVFDLQPIKKRRSTYFLEPSGDDDFILTLLFFHPGGITSLLLLTVSCPVRRLETCGSEAGSKQSISAQRPPGKNHVLPSNSFTKF